MKTLLAIAVTALFLAGCLGTSTPGFTSQLNEAYSFDGKYNWNVLETTDDQGNWLRNDSVLAPGFAGPRSFQQYAPLGGAEPAIGVIPNPGGNPYLILATWETVQRSSDYGQTWQVVRNFSNPGYPAFEDRWMTNGVDLWVDPVSHNVYVTQLYVEQWNPPAPPYSQCFDLSRSKDAGTTWEHVALAHCWPIAQGNVAGTRASVVVGNMIHQKVVSGPPAPGGSIAFPDAMRDGYKENVYVCYSSDPFMLGTGEACVTSPNGGTTFPQRGLLKATTTCEITRTGRQAVGPQGQLAVPVGWTYTPIPVWMLIDGGLCPVPPTVFTSTDSGLTWEEHVEPSGQWLLSDGGIDGLMDPSVTYTPDGTGYFFFQAFKDRQVYYFRSKDNFVNWEGPFRVSPKDLTITQYASAVAGDDGRVAVAYLGTRQPQYPGAWSGNASGNSHWALFITSTFDAAAEHPTFTTQQVTPNEDPVQVGCIIPPFGFAGPLFGNCFNLQNFITMTVDAEGRYMVGFTDGCNPRVGCTGDTESGFWLKDREGAIAILDQGEGLRAGKILASLGLTHTEPKEHADGKI